jgi:hypothetical protein
MKGVSIAIGMLLVLVILPVAFLSKIETMTINWEARHFMRNAAVMPWYVRAYYALKK